MFSAESLRYLLSWNHPDITLMQQRAPEIDAASLLLKNSHHFALLQGLAADCEGFGGSKFSPAIFNREWVQNGEPRVSAELRIGLQVIYFIDELHRKKRMGLRSLGIGIDFTKNGLCAVKVTGEKSWMKLPTQDHESPVAPILLMPTLGQIESMVAESKLQLMYDDRFDANGIGRRREIKPPYNLPQLYPHQPGFNL